MIRLATKNKVVNFRNFISNFVIERHHIVVEEVDVVRALCVINSHHMVVPNIKVGNCGWKDDPSKWFIHFTTTKSKWLEIRTRLNVIRVFADIDIPRNVVGYAYTTD